MIDQVLIEQVVQILCADNLELGCNLIEQAVIEKAIKDINESLEPLFLTKEIARESDISLRESSHLSKSKKMQLEFSHILNLENPITSKHLNIYTNFINISPLKKLEAAVKALTLIYKNINDIKDSNKATPPYQYNGNLIQNNEEINNYSKANTITHSSNIKEKIYISKDDIKINEKMNLEKYNINNKSKNEHHIANIQNNNNKENYNEQNVLSNNITLEVNLQLHKVLKKLELATGQLKEAINDIINLPPILFNVNKEINLSNVNKMNLYLLYSLSVDGNIFNLIKSIPEIAALTKNKYETIISYTNKIYTFLLEITLPIQQTQVSIKSIHVTGIYLEVFLCILEKLKYKCPLLKDRSILNVIVMIIL